MGKPEEGFMAGLFIFRNREMHVFRISMKTHVFSKKAFGFNNIIEFLWGTVSLNLNHCFSWEI